MKLHRIALNDFRGVTASEVSFEAPGITVVVGPNEIGKSSIAEALTLIRTYKDSSRHRDIVAVKPTHRDVGPQVEIEVETGAYRFVYTKRWFRKPSTELRILAPTAEQLTGDEAHDRVEQIFAATLDPELWTALQQVQGDSLQQASLANVAPLHSALSAAAARSGESGDSGQSGESGEDQSGDFDDAHSELMASIESRFRQFFTRTGSPTGEHARSITEVTDLAAELEAADTRLCGVDDRVERHATLTGQRARLVERTEAARAELDEFEARSAGITSLRAALEGAQGRLREAQLAETAARSAVDGRAERDTEAATARAALVEAVKLVDEAAAADAVHENEQSSHAEAHASARARLDLARTSLATATTEIEWARDRYELARLDDRVAAATVTSTRLQELATALAVNGLDAKALQRLTDAHSAVQTARAAASSGAARIAVHRLGSAEVLLDGVPIDSESATDVLAQTSVEVADVVRVVVTPDASAAERAAEADRLQHDLDMLLSTSEVVDLSAARSRAADRDQLRESLQRAESELEGLLAGESIEAMRGRVTALAERLGAGPSDDADTNQTPAGDVDALLDAARDEFDEAQAAVEAGAADRETRTSRSQSLALTLARAQTRLEGLEHDAERAQKRLDTDRAANPDEALVAALASIDVELIAATSLVTDARSALDVQDADVLEAELTNARDRQGRHVADLDQLTRDLSMLDGELEALGRDGLRDAVDQARSRLDDATRTRDALQARAAAARLLFETMSAHQLSTRQRYVTPFRTSITALGKIVFGADFSVEIGDDLAIASRTLDGVTVPFDSLSGGAREQLSVIGRLATARLVSDDDGAPVILDDSLGFTDAARRSKLAAVLNLVGTTSQIIILTCEPERFSDIGKATTVHLS